VQTKRPHRRRTWTAAMRPFCGRIAAVHRKRGSLVFCGYLVGTLCGYPRGTHIGLLTYVGKPSHLCGMAYPHRWSPVSYKSSAGQRKHIGQRPILYQLGSTAMRCGCAGLVQPWPGVRVGRVLCEVRRARLQAPSVLPPRAAQQR